VGILLPTRFILYLRANHDLNPEPLNEGTQIATLVTITTTTIQCRSKASKLILMMSKTQVKNQDSSKFQESKSHSIKNQDSSEDSSRRLKICKNFKRSIKISIKRFFSKEKIE